MTGWNGGSVDFAWFNPFATIPYGVIQSNTARTLFFFFFNAQNQVTAISSNQFTSDVIVMGPQGTNLAKFLQKNANGQLRIISFNITADDVELQTVKQTQIWTQDINSTF